MRLKVPKNPPPGHMRLALYANSEEPNETQSQPKGYSDPKNLSKYSKKTSPMTYIPDLPFPKYQTNLHNKNRQKTQLKTPKNETTIQELRPTILPQNPLQQTNKYAIQHKPIK
jgi:hypothetical protein